MNKNWEKRTSVMVELHSIRTLMLEVIDCVTCVMVGTLILAVVGVCFYVAGMVPVWVCGRFMGEPACKCN